MKNKDNKPVQQEEIHEEAPVEETIPTEETQPEKEETEVVKVNPVKKILGKISAHKRVIGMFGGIAAGVAAAMVISRFKNNDDVDYDEDEFNEDEDDVDEDIEDTAEDDESEENDN